jgi:hypothetical protein
MLLDYLPSAALLVGAAASALAPTKGLALRFAAAAATVGGATVIGLAVAESVAGWPRSWGR